MKTKTFYRLSFLLIASSLIAGIVLYPKLPSTVASHWGLNGEVNGYLNKFWGVFLLPAATLIIIGLFAVLPKIDPLKKNIAMFRKQYNGIIFAVILMLTYIWILSLVFNLGADINMGTYTPPAVGALFVYIGFLLPQTKRNWFLGVRTPWTISSDTVWQKTHKLGGKLFIAAGAATALSALNPSRLFAASLILTVTAVLFLLIYSYIQYRAENS